jgi:hypothetical protein
MAAKCCIVYLCENRADQGDFVGDLCAPCHAFVTGKRWPPMGGFSQAYRNAITLAVQVLLADDPTGAVRKAL